MESLPKGPIKYKGRLLVAYGKRDGDPYTLVLGKVTKKETPTIVDNRWDKKEEGMFSARYPKKDKVIWVPVERTDELDDILRKLGFKHYKDEYSYLTWGPERPRYVDEQIVTSKYGFMITHLALVSLGEEESAMDIIFPENERSRIFKLTQFFS